MDILGWNLVRRSLVILGTNTTVGFLPLFSDVEGRSGLYRQREGRWLINLVEWFGDMQARCAKANSDRLCQLEETFSRCGGVESGGSGVIWCFKLYQV